MLRTMEHEMTIINLLLHEYNWNRKKCGYIKQRLKQTKKKRQRKKKQSNDGHANINDSSQLK